MFSTRLKLFVLTMAGFVGCQSTTPRPIAYDLTPAKNSEEAFERLKEGMTKKQFEQILGEPGISDALGPGAKMPVRTTWKYPKFGVEVACSLQGKLLTKSLTQTAYFPQPKSAIEVVDYTEPVSKPIEVPDLIGPVLQTAQVDAEGWGPVSSVKSTQVNKPAEAPNAGEAPKAPEAIKAPEVPGSPVAVKSLDEVGKRVYRGMNGKQVEAALMLKPDIEIVVQGMGHERYYRSLECCLIFDEYDELFKYYRVWASKMPTASGVQDLFTLKPRNYEEAVERLKRGMTLEQVTRRLGKAPSLNSTEQGINTSWWPELDCILFFGPVGLENWSRATPANQPAAAKPNL